MSTIETDPFGKGEGEKLYGQKCGERSCYWPENPCALDQILQQSKLPPERMAELLKNCKKAQQN